MEPSEPGEPVGGDGEPTRRASPLLWVAGAVIVAGVGFLIWARVSAPVPEPRGPDPVAVINQRMAEVDFNLAALEQRLDAVDQRLEALAEQSGGAAAAGDVAGLASRVNQAADGIAGIDRRLSEAEARLENLAALDRKPVVTSEGAVTFDSSALEARIAALEASPSGSLSGGHETVFETIEALDGAEARRLAALADDLAARITALESRPTPTGGAAATMLAVAQLRAALDGSGTFDAELAAVRAAIDGGEPVAAALDALAPYAAAGIPTTAMLRARFTGLADDVVRAGYAPPQDTWVARTMARLAKLVTVRRTGDDVMGATPEAIAARAEARLAAGDLAGAVA
ncbi:MAG: mitofilin family membrane protein, partial [Alphaproteobacteria bacterium]